MEARTLGAPAIIGSLPLIGGAVSAIWILVASVAGAREVYRIGSTRALIVVLFPKLIFLGLILATILTVLLVFFQLFSHMV